MLQKHKWSLMITVATLLAGAFTLASIDPNTLVPIHWSIKGEIDREAPAYWAMFLMPLAQIFVILVFSFLKFLEPREKNLEDSAAALRSIVIATTGLLAFIQLILIDRALQTNLLTINLIFAGTGVMLIVIGNYLSKVRPSFFVGIRTPWTLSSDIVWKKTHRLGSKLFIIAGATITIGSFFLDMHHFPKLILLTVLPAALAPAIYSWWLWRQHKEAAIED